MVDFGTLFGGKATPDDEERATIIKYAKQNYPHLVYDSVPIEWDESHKDIKNKDLVSSLWGWQKEVMYNLNPKETPIVISHLTNGSGKTWLLTLMLTLLLIDDHPCLSKGFMGIKGEFWLLTNTSLLKTEYPKAFLKSPGFLGNEEVYKNNGLFNISNSRGEKFQIRCLRDNDGTVTAFENITNGKSIKFWSYSVNEQKLAGHNPLSIFCDEFGDKTMTSGASGANRLTWGKFEEMIVRCGRNHATANNWVFCLFFTLTLGEAWIEDMIDMAKDGQMIIPELNNQRNLPPNHQCVHLVKGTATTDNPFINKSTIQVALGLGDLLGRGDGLARRLLSTDGDDPNLVFPRDKRPKKLTILDSKSIIEKATHEAGWMFIQSIDPGWRDKCAVLFALCHPIKGIFVLDEIYESGLTVPKVAAIVKTIEYNKFNNRVVDKRLYDPNHIGKTTQESPVANYKLWKDSGLPGIRAVNSRDRAYDRLFELIYRGLISYDPISAPGMDRELRTHRKDAHGIPEERQNNHCMAPGTMIYTSKGYQAIETIDVGELVLTSQGFRKVLESGVSGRDVNSILTKISYIDNNNCLKSIEVHSTADHKVKIDNNSWISIGELQKGMKISLHKSIMEKSIDFIEEKDTSQEAVKDFIELSGKQRQVQKFPMDTMSITLMGILGITASAILNLSSHLNIFQNMPLSIAVPTKRRLDNILTLLGIKPLNGTNLRKEWSGINNMLQTLVSGFIPRKESVSAAGKNIQQKLGTQDSVTKTVSNVVGHEDLEIVEIQSVEFIDKGVISKVYDLTVEECHEYIANGLLVHNSIDALRYIANWFYEDYAKKIHLAIPKEQSEISPERAAYYEQLEYYNKFVKPALEDKKDTTNSILGVKLKGISKNSLKGFKKF